MKVINLFGGPGSGKSTTAAGLFFQMKNRGLKVELVTEFAKDLTYEGGHTLSNQLAILGEQHRRLSRLRGHVDWVVTDSPLLLGLVYMRKDDRIGGWLREAIIGAYSDFDNFNVLLRRIKPYQSYGRSQTYEEACDLDVHILNVVNLLSVGEIVWVDGSPEAPAKILESLQLEKEFA